MIIDFMEYLIHKDKDRAYQILNRAYDYSFQAENKYKAIEYNKKKNIELEKYKV